MFDRKTCLKCPANEVIGGCINFSVDKDKVDSLITFCKLNDYVRMFDSNLSQQLREYHAPPCLFVDDEGNLLPKYKKELMEMLL